MVEERDTVFHGKMSVSVDGVSKNVHTRMDTEKQACSFRRQIKKNGIKN